VLLWICSKLMEFKKGTLYNHHHSNVVGKFVMLTKGNTHYHYVGNKNDPLVIFLHGFSVPMQPYVDSGMAEFYVKAGYRFLSYDFYGRGHSDAPDVEFTPQLFVEQLSELLNALNITDNFDFVGYSMGGALALYYAQAHPAKVKKMALISSAGVKLNLNFNVLVKIFRFPIVGQMIFRFFIDSFLNPKRDEHITVEDPITKIMSQSRKDQSQHQGLIRSLYSTLLNFQMENLNDVLVDVAQHTRDIFIVHGDSDYLVPYTSALSLHNQFTGSKLKTIKGGTHSILIEQLKEVNESILEFL